MHRESALGAIGIALFLPCLARAMTSEDVQVGSIRAVVYAPDWCWQGLHVNIFCLVENTGDADTTVVLRLDAQGGRWPFVPSKEDPNARPQQKATVAAGRTARVALANLKVAVDAPIASYPLQLHLDCGGRRRVVDYALAVIRGPALPATESTIFVIAGICLVWVCLMAIVLSRWAHGKAWRTPSEPFEETVTEGDSIGGQ